MLAALAADRNAAALGGLAVAALFCVTAKASPAPDAPASSLNSTPPAVTCSASMSGGYYVSNGTYALRVQLRGRARGGTGGGRGCGS